MPASKQPGEKEAGEQAASVRLLELRELLTGNPKPPGVLGQALKILLQAHRLHPMTKKKERDEQLQSVIDQALLADLVKYSPALLRRMRQLIPRAIARQEKLAPREKIGHRSKTDAKRLQQAKGMHDIFVSNGLSSADADELVASLLGFSKRTAERDRTRLARQKGQKKTPS